ncbi:MAG: zinc-binding dehydrogenase, partial [Chloroflexi bacterium]|nr:zinc-binding dehydrogenase [Chloroflexota bacterium]
MTDQPNAQPLQTQAVVITAPEQVELQTVTLRDPAPDEVIIQTAYTSISAGTERMLFGGQMPHPMLQLPVIPGYETVGRVVETGADVLPSLKDTWVYVGGAQCYQGINAAWGGQAATIITGAQRVIPLDGIAPRHGLILALAATALHGIDVLNPAMSRRILVIGQGPVGQLAARLARLRETWVAVSDLNADRLRRAEADLILDAADGPLSERLGAPVDAIIEASGSMTALTEALPALANGGTILLLGYYQQLTLPYMPLFLKEARLLTAKEWGPHDLDRCRDLLAEGKLDAAPLLTHELPI